MSIVITRHTNTKLVTSKVQNLKKKLTISRARTKHVLKLEDEEEEEQKQEEGEQQEGGQEEVEE